MMRNRFVLICFVLLSAFQVNAQNSDGTSSSGIRKSYTHEFFLSGGYNWSMFRSVDFGLRYYHWKNDGQQIMAFSGLAAGCELSVGQQNKIIIPYAGWQGQAMLLAFGIRLERAAANETASYNITTDIGLSIFEMLRITAGYRTCFDSNDPLEMRGLRFSVVAALPLSFVIGK